MRQKLRIKKGDLVAIIAGEGKTKKGDKGRKILAVYPSKNRVLVEGVNMKTKHVKPNATHPQGAVIKQEAPIHISNVMILCPETGEPTKVGKRESSEAGKDGKKRLVRFSKKSDKELS